MRKNCNKNKGGIKKVGEIIKIDDLRDHTFFILNIYFVLFCFLEKNNNKKCCCLFKGSKAGNAPCRKDIAEQLLPRPCNCWRAGRLGIPHSAPAMLLSSVAAPFPHALQDFGAWTQVVDAKLSRS